MSPEAFDPALWSWMTIEIPATAPGGYANGLIPQVREAAPLYAAGWQAHEHMWLGNGWVRLVLRKARVSAILDDLARAAQDDEAERSAALLEAVGRGVERENRHGRSPYGVDLRTVAERAADEAHLAKLRMAPGPVAYRDVWFEGPPSARKPTDLARAVWGDGVSPIGDIDLDAPTIVATPIDDTAARRAWGMRAP